MEVVWSSWLCARRLLESYRNTCKLHEVTIRGNIDELYNLDNDPHELHNLACEPSMQETLAEMKRKLLAHMKHTKDRLGHAWPLLLGD